MKRHKHYFKKKVKICSKIRYQHHILLYLRNNFFSKKQLKQKVFNILILRSKFYSYMRLKQFCIYTGRLRFIINNTKMSRMMFKKNVSCGYIVGTFKLS